MGVLDLLRLELKENRQMSSTGYRKGYRILISRLIGFSKKLMFDS